MSSHDIPTSPFFGNRFLESIPSVQVLPYLNQHALFHARWKLTKPEQQKEAEKIFQRCINDAKKNQLIQPKAIYGYYACNSDGNTVIIYSQEGKVLTQFEFTRNTKTQFCLSDYFLPVDSKQKDLIAFQAVTVGKKSDDYAKALYKQNEYQYYFYWHGFQVAMAEAIAEYVHHHIRMELGFFDEEPREIKELFQQKYRSKRYSLGYPTCPNLADQQKILSLLRAERMGLTLTENDQLIPEASTTAIIVIENSSK